MCVTCCLSSEEENAEYHHQHSSPGVLSLSRTFDYDLVKRIVTDPRVYPHISDDGSPGADEFEPAHSQAVWYLLVLENSEPAGVITYVPQNFVCYEVHTCLLPSVWGRHSLEAARLSIEFMFQSSPCRRIVTNVPDYNRVALRFARRSGLEEFGLNPQSYLHRGVLYDQHMLGISKEDICR